MVAQVVREAALPATILMTRHGTAGYYRVRRSHPFSGDGATKRASAPLQHRTTISIPISFAFE